MTPRIILTGGGTAGSVSPLLALVEYFHEQAIPADWLFVGSADGPERSLAETIELPYAAIPAGKLRRYWSLKNFSDLSALWRGFGAARKLIQDWKPDIIISAGSYVSVPLVWAGKLAGTKIIIHQQDVRPGLANRLMAPMADRITVSFESSLKQFPGRKTVLTGNPVRAGIFRGRASQAMKLFHLQPNIPVLLVLGGSTGSSYLNTLIGAVGYRLVQHWQIIHITGRNRDYIELQDERYHRVDFLTWELPHVMAAATLVISRAGLSTLTELAALGKPAIFLPLPNTHQQDNAEWVARQKAGVILDQYKTTPAEFFDLVESLRKQVDRRTQFGENLHQFYRPDAVAKLHGLIQTLLP